MTDSLTNPGVITLICAVREMHAPPLFFTEDGRRRGYEPEAAELVAATLGLGVRWHHLRWDLFRDELEAGAADAIWCGSAITPERRQIFDYSAPYAIFGESVLVRRDSGIGTAEGLRGRRVGAIRASTNLKLAASFPDVRLVEFDGASDDVFGEMCEAVRSGTVDAIVDDECAFGEIDRDTDLTVGFTVPTGNAWGAALRKGSPELATLVDHGLAEAIDSGALGDVWRRWFPGTPFPL